jgi:DNA helicase-2/ATP-dependent DNA helicase PcrA
MNFHKSKGKEFDGVVIVERRYKGKLLNDDEAPRYTESRRVLRVAITRARKRVTILRPVGALPLVGG